MVGSLGGRRVTTAVLALAGLAWLIVALRAATPLIPDEYAYILGGIELDRPGHVKALAPNVPEVANYLYLRLINIFWRLHLPIDVAVKLVNVASVVLAARLIGGLVLAHGGFWRATLLFGLIAFLPSGAAVAYVMPETPYLLAFTVLFCLFARSPRGPTLALWALAGALIALMVLIKAHGLFAMAALLAATPVWAAISGRLRLVRVGQLCLAALVAFALSLALGKMALGPHDAGQDVVGGYYWDWVGGALPSWERFSIAALSAVTQGAAVLLLFAPSVVFLVLGVVTERRGGPVEGRDLTSFLAVFIFLLIGVVLAVSSYLLIVDSNRMLLRYISFAYPGLLALAWIWANGRPELDTRAFRIAAAVVWIAAGGFFLYRLGDLRPIAHDAPEHFFSHFNPEAGAFGLGRLVWPFAAVTVGAGALALLHPRVRWFDAQLGVLAVLFTVGALNTVIWQGQWSASRAGFRALGEAARTLCPPGDRGVVAVGHITSLESFYTTLTPLGRAAPLAIATDPPLTMLTPAEGSCIVTSLDLDSVHGPPITQHDGLKLYRASQPPAGAWKIVEAVRFGQGKPTALLGQGWSDPEADWVWSDARSVSLNLRRPAATGLQPTILELNVSAFTPPGLSSQRVRVAVDGRPAAEWQVQYGSYRVTLPAPQASGAPVQVTLSLPDAAVPAQVIPGHPDRRLLGVALREVTFYAPAGP